MDRDEVYVAVSTNDEGCPNIAVRVPALEGTRVASAEVSPDGELYVVTVRDRDAGRIYL